MGFGILFFGYLISFNTIAYPGFTKIISYLVMLLAMTKLGQYNRYLKSAFSTLIPASVVGFLYFLLEGASFFSLLSAENEDLLFRLIPLASYFFELFFLYFLFRGLQELATETGVPVLIVTAFRNRIFTSVYYVLFILGQFNYGESSAAFLIRYNIILMLVGFVIMFLNAKMIYSFYMWICLPEDAEMKRKTSRFAFVDKIYAKMDAAEERRLARRTAADAAYRREKQAKKQRKKKRK